MKMNGHSQIVSRNYVYRHDETTQACPAPVDVDKKSYPYARVRARVDVPSHGQARFFLLSCPEEVLPCPE